MSDCFDVSALSIVMPRMYCVMLIVGYWSADWLMSDCFDVSALSFVMPHMYCVMASLPVVDSSIDSCLIALMSQL